jgi:phospholipase C
MLAVSTPRQRVASSPGKGHGRLRINREFKKKRRARNTTGTPGFGTIGRVNHSRLLAAGCVLLLAAATAVASTAASGAGAGTADPGAGGAAPGAGTAGSGAVPDVPIKHVIEIMIENHSFDNLFGKFAGADGIPANASLLNPNAYYDSAPNVQPA